MSGQVFQDPSTGKFYQEVPGPSGLVPYGGGGYMGAPAGVYPQGYAQPQDMNASLISTLIPAIITLPSLQNGTAVAVKLADKLKALTVPTPSPGNPTQAEHNALLSYTNEVKAAIQDAVGNDATVFESVRKQVMFSVILPMMSGNNGGNGSVVALVLLMALGGF